MLWVGFSLNVIKKGLFGLLPIFTTLAMKNPGLTEVCPQQQSPL